MDKKADPPKKISLFFIPYLNSIKAAIISRISKDPLLKGIMILGSGTALSQVLGIIFVPVITRLYPPEIYGTLAVFTSLLALLIVSGTLRYDQTIPIPQKEDDAEYLLILSFFILSILTVILFVILTVSGDFFASTFHFEFISPYYWLFCIGFFGSCAYQILTFWAIRSKDWMQITQTRVAQSFSGSVSKIIFGVLSFGSLGLICGELIGRIVGIVSLGRTILPKVWQSIKDINFCKMKSLAYRFKKFPLFSLPAGFISELSFQVPILMISAHYGLQTVGLFTLCYSMLVLPVSFVSGSISQAYSGENYELVRQKSDKILDFYFKTTKKLFLFGAPIILVGAIFSPILFPIIFGSEWNEAGIFSLPLCSMIIAQFVVSSTDALPLYGYNDWSLIWNICRTFFVISGFLLAFQFGLTPVATILVFSLIMTLMYAVSYILNITAIKLVLKNNFLIHKNE